MTLIRWTAALAALALAPGPAAAEVKNWQEKFRVSNAPVIRVEADDADVQVLTGPPGGVEARVRYEFKNLGFTTRPRAPRVSLSQQGDVVTVIARDPVWAMSAGITVETMKVEVTVPESCDVRVRTGDGAVRVEGPLSGRLDVGTGDGRITVRGCRGELRFASGDGGITGSDLAGSVSAGTGDGRIELEGRFDVVTARSGDGALRVVAGPGSTMGGEWRLETGDGTLDLKIPRGLRATLDAGTRDGRLAFELPVSVPGGVGRHGIRGRLNGGGPPLVLRTGDGTLRIGVSN